MLHRQRATDGVEVGAALNPRYGFVFVFWTDESGGPCVLYGEDSSASTKLIFGFQLN